MSDDKPPKKSKKPPYRRLRPPRKPVSGTMVNENPDDDPEVLDLGRGFAFEREAG